MVLRPLWEPAFQIFDAPRGARSRTRHVDTNRPQRLCNGPPFACRLPWLATCPCASPCLHLLKRWALGPPVPFFSYLMDLASELRAEKMVTFHKCWRLYIIPVIADVIFGKSLPICPAT